MIPRANRIVWYFAAGYFLCYAVYSALIKQATSGADELPGLVLLPSVTFGTAITLPLIVTLLGWWRTSARFDRDTLIAGAATGVIILTTTLAYTFDGVSIVFTLLLLRGGVLILAPIVDRICGRAVRWFCWAAFLASMGALAIALSHLRDTNMTVIAALNTCAYLASYAIRLPRMTRCAKVSDQDPTRSWFLGEMTVALAVQLIVPLGAALLPGTAAAQLRSGITGISTTGLLIGVLYGALYFFGTSVYLDRRENTFCVPLNRGASLLAGLVATVAIGVTPTPAELAAASLVVAALLFLSPVHHLPETFFARLQRAMGKKELLP